MLETKLIFTALAELSTRQVAENATGMEENRKAAVKGGKVANRARKDFEKTKGKKVVTGDNFKKPKQIKNKD